MINQAELYRVYKIEKNYNTTASYFGVSRQRIEQLLRRCTDPEVLAIQAYNRLHVTMQCIECTRSFPTIPARSGALCRLCRVFLAKHPSGVGITIRPHTYPTHCRGMHCQKTLVKGKRIDGYCKPCYDKQYNLRHRPERIIRDQQYYTTQREKRLAYAKDYALAHREKLLAYQKQYYKEHTQLVLARQKRSRLGNLEKRRERERGYQRKYYWRKKHMNTNSQQLTNVL